MKKYSVIIPLLFAALTAPEPDTFALMLVGIIGFLPILRKRSAQELHLGAETRL